MAFYAIRGPESAQRLQFPPSQNCDFVKLLQGDGYNAEGKESRHWISAPASSSTEHLGLHPAVEMSSRGSMYPNIQLPRQKGVKKKERECLWFSILIVHRCV